MATKKKVENENITEEKKELVMDPAAGEVEIKKVEKPVEEAKKAEEKAPKASGKQPKYAIGSVVFIHKEADADLNGFKLFPQYKKYTYTVEAYDAKSEVYSLRRLNLSLRLKESDIIAPHEKSGSALMGKQY